MRLLLCVLACFFLTISSLSQNIKGVQCDTINSCERVWDSNRIVRKEIKTELFSFVSNYQYGEKSYLKAKLNLIHLFDTIKTFLDSGLKNSLEIEMPYHQFKVENKIGYSYMYKVKYKGVNHTIFRDCGCGVYKGFRIIGGRFSGYNNQLFNQKTRFDLKSRNRYESSNSLYRFFDFSLENGLPTKFISYQDSTKMDKKIIFINGKVDSVKSYYENGGLEYEASITEGQLNGYFIFYFEDGGEKFKVCFNKNKVVQFINELGSYYYDEEYGRWMIN